MKLVNIKINYESYLYIHEKCYKEHSQFKVSSTLTSYSCNVLAITLKTTQLHSCLRTAIFLLIGATFHSTLYCQRYMFAGERKRYKLSENKKVPVAK